jgi:hypothetical protein
MWVAKLSRKDFKRIFEVCYHVDISRSKIAEEEPITVDDDVLSAMSRSAVMRVVPAPRHTELALAGRVRTFAFGTTIVAQDKPACSMFLIVSGQGKVSRRVEELVCAAAEANF